MSRRDSVPVVECRWTETAKVFKLIDILESPTVQDDAALHTVPDEIMENG